jgi:hypothetical protein
MKKTVFLVLCLGALSAANTGRAIDLKESKITQVVNDVQIISAADQTEKPARLNGRFTMPDILRTGPASRAELVAEDETITRVGANTIFSFDPASRTIDLKQGSLLFHSPHGKGGGTIHTGSATASVLGTTLIVTTTPSGGLKVLDIEGKVEVKFLNGLKQKLYRGQMTFILAGGNQLAPIIVFRLDNLTKNSLLLKGFNHELASMPLILSQIEKQLSLIRTGRYTDTGLLVGDNATASQVQVLDPNTLQSDLDQSGLNTPEENRALAADATINQSSLTSPDVPTPPNHIFFDGHFILPDNSFFVGQPFVGFAAHNIFFNTAGTEAPAVSVDLSPYADHTEFDMVAAGNMEFDGAVNFTGLSPADGIYFDLVAGKQILIAPDVTIGVNVANFEMESADAFTLNGSTIENGIGNTDMEFGSDVTLENNAVIETLKNLDIKTDRNFSVADSFIGANGLEFSALGGSLTVNSSTLITGPTAIFTAAKGITVNSSVINAGASGSVTFKSASGSVSLANNSIQAQYLTINSGDGILLSGTGMASQGGGGGVAHFTAPNLITVNTADLSAFAAVNMVAHTINLYNVIFKAGSVDNFGTHTGLATVNQSGNASGELNLHDVTYGETAITSTSQINFSSGPSSAAGINSYANGH